MVPVEWKQEYSVGIAEIDGQHKNFINLLNQTFSTLESENRRVDLAKNLEDIIAHANEHFATEEKYFDQFQYPEGETHRREHHRIRTEVVKIKERFPEEGVAVIGELVVLLEDWLLDHIMQYDKKYIDFFHEHGLR